MASLSSATQYTSRPVETVTESGRSRTLQEVLISLLADLRGEDASVEARKPESSDTSTSEPKNTLVGCQIGRSFLVRHPQPPFESLGSSDQDMKIA